MFKGQAPSYLEKHISSYHPSRPLRCKCWFTAGTQTVEGWQRLRQNQLPVQLWDADPLCFIEDEGRTAKAAGVKKNDALAGFSQPSGSPFLVIHAFFWFSLVSIYRYHVVGKWPAESLVLRCLFLCCLGFSIKEMWFRKSDELVPGSTCPLHPWW